MRCYRGLAPAGRSARGPRRNASRRELAAEECPRGHQQSFQPRVRKGWPVRAATAVGGRAAPASVAVAPNGIYEAASRAPRIHKVMMQREGKCTSFFLFYGVSWLLRGASLDHYCSSLLNEGISHSRTGFWFLVVSSCVYTHMYVYVCGCVSMFIDIYLSIYMYL